MSALLDRLLFIEVARLRPYLLAKMLLGMLGLDCLVELIPHAARYGVEGFNVAHAAILDRLLPMPTPALYVGCLVTVAGLCFVSVVGRIRRPIVVAITVLYTLAWASSLLDSYQHHYLISLWLVSLCACPDATAVELIESERRTASAPGYVSFVATTAIVYAFTALAKLEPGFLDGSALARLTTNGELDPLVRAFGALGVTADESFAWLARGTVVAQLVSSVALFVGLAADSGARRLRVVSAILGLVPVSFHLAANRLGLGIGWFGEYMLVVVTIVFCPAAVLEAVRAAGLRIARLRPALRTRSDPLRIATTFVALGVGTYAYSLLFLPGAFAGGIVALCLCVGLGAGGFANRFEFVGRIVGAWSVAALVSAVAIVRPGFEVEVGPLLFIGAPSSVRYDYYRFSGGDSMRRGELRTGRAAYELALRFAPDEMRRQVTRDRLARTEDVDP